MQNPKNVGFIQINLPALYVNYTVVVRCLNRTSTKDINMIAMLSKSNYQLLHDHFSYQEAEMTDEKHSCSTQVSVVLLALDIII